MHPYWVGSALHSGTLGQVNHNSRGLVPLSENTGPLHIGFELILALAHTAVLLEIPEGHLLLLKQQVTTFFIIPAADICTIGQVMLMRTLTIFAVSRPLPITDL